MPARAIFTRLASNGNSEKERSSTAHAAKIPVIHDACDGAHCQLYLTKTNVSIISRRILGPAYLSQSIQSSAGFAGCFCPSEPSQLHALAAEATNAAAEGED